MISLSGSEVARQITKNFPDAVLETSNGAIVVKSDSIFNVADYLKNSPELDFDYLNYITAVDYYD